MKLRLRVPYSWKPLAKLVERLFLVTGIVLLGYCAFLYVEALQFQRWAIAELETNRPPQPGLPVLPGDLIGRLNINRIGISVAIVEGSTEEFLRRAAGHIPGTAQPGRPGNSGISAHRDTFFRPLRKIAANDVVEISTRDGNYRYKVVSTIIVMPEDVWVLAPDDKEVLTLITCYPFYYVGSAPKRFIVRAERLADAS